VPFAQSVLDLIAGQDYPNLEVLFIDDGKPGTLVSVLREHYDIKVHSQIEGGEPMMYKAIKPHLGANNLSVVVLELGHQSSLSIGAKRYAAAQRARGSVLVHWDDDDLYPPERVRLQVEPILAGEAQLTVLGHTLFGDLPFGNFYKTYTNPVYLGSLAYTRTIALNLGFADVSLGEDLLCRSRARGLQPAARGSRRRLGVHAPLVHRHSQRSSELVVVGVRA
jgi:glycosyltransferase involved in cell wall biosynthesis